MSDTSIYFKDNVTEEGHGRRSLHGGAISLLARAVNAALQIGSILFLARLLAVEDYGLVAMVMAITGFATALVDLGTRDAIVQRHSITEGEISALFWITLGIGFGLAIVVAACAPLIAWFYHEPRLISITLLSSVTFITYALTCQHYALLRRAMKFHELGMIEVFANILSVCVAIAMAFAGFHYWALVVRPIVLSGLLVIGLWVRCRWLPRKPTMTQGVKDMLKFGLNTAGFTFTDYVGNSSDRVAIGYRSGPVLLGYYQNSSFIYNNLLDVLVFPLHQVAVSSLSKVRHDFKELRRLWSKALSTLSFYAMPAFGLLAVTSRDIVVILLGSKWSRAGVLLSILALRGIPHTVERTLGWLHVTSGRTDRWMRFGAFAAVVQLIALFAGLPFGVIGVIVAFVISMFLLFIPAIAYAGQPFGIGAKDVVKVVWRQMTGALGAAGIGFLLRYAALSNLPGVARTAILTVTYVGVYLLMVVGLFRVRMPVGVVLQLVRDILPKRFAKHVRTPHFIARHSYEHI